MQSSLRPAVFNSSSQNGFLFDLLWGFFLLLPKQLQAWKGMRHRATSNLLACKRNRMFQEQKRELKGEREEREREKEGTEKKRASEKIKKSSGLFTCFLLRILLRSASKTVLYSKWDATYCFVFN